MLITEQKQVDRIIEIIDSCTNDVQLRNCDNFINPKYFEYKSPLDKSSILISIVAKECKLLVQFVVQYL